MGQPSVWVGTGTYHVTQAWAALFDRAGFDGNLCSCPSETPQRGQCLLLSSPSADVVSRRADSGY